MSLHKWQTIEFRTKSSTHLLSNEKKYMQELNVKIRGVPEPEKYGSFSLREKFGSLTVT